MGSEFRCPKCGSIYMRVIYSTFNKNRRYRRRECTTCDHRITTYEVPRDDVKNMVGEIAKSKLELIKAFCEFIENPNKWKKTILGKKIDKFNEVWRNSG